MEVSIKQDISINVETLAREMTTSEVGALLNEVALRFDSDFLDRANFARQFADNTSETGARFLAEIVAHRFIKRE